MARWTARQREVLVTAAELKEISKIMDFLELTRPAIDQSLTALSRSEECRGVTLWVGSPSGHPAFPLVLTPAGEEMLPHIRELVAKNDSATRTLASFRGGQQGRVRVGCLEVHLEGPLGLIAPRFHRNERLITVDMSHGSKDPTPSEASVDLDQLLWKPLRAGRLDIVFGGEARREFENHVVYTTSIVAGVEEDHPWRQRGWVETEELLEHSLGMLPKGYFSRDRMTDVLASYGLTEPAHVRPTVRALELLRDGLDVIPVVADEGIGKMDESVPFPRVLVDGSPISGNMCVHWRRKGAPTSEVAKRFLALVRHETPGEGHLWNANLSRNRET
jgi:DNA-binding transcriptional LysR family regulator